MFGTLGGPELILILVLALIVFGPRKLPEIGKSLGRMMAEFRSASNEFRRTLEDEVEAEKYRSAPPPASLAEPRPGDYPTAFGEAPSVTTVETPPSGPTPTDAGTEPAAPGSVPRNGH